MKKWTITGHALIRAKTRWMQPSEKEAERAIRRVLRLGVGESSPDGSVVYKLGSHGVVVRGDEVVTALCLYRGRVDSWIRTLRTP